MGRHPAKQLARAERAQLRQQRLQRPRSDRSRLPPDLSSSVGHNRRWGAAQRPGRIKPGTLESPKVLRLRTSLSHDTARKLRRCVRAALRCWSLHCCAWAAPADESDRCLLLCHAASDVRGPASACPGRSSTLRSTHGVQKPAHMLGCMVRSCRTYAAYGRLRVRCSHRLARQRSDCLKESEQCDLKTTCMAIGLAHALPEGGHMCTPEDDQTCLCSTVCFLVLRSKSGHQDQGVFGAACDMGQTGFRRPLSGSTANACFAGTVPRHSFVGVLARREACQTRRSRHSGRPAQQDSRRLDVRAGFGDELLDFILGREPASHAGLFSQPVCAQWQRCVPLGAGHVCSLACDSDVGGNTAAVSGVSL